MEEYPKRETENVLYDDSPAVHRGLFGRTAAYNVTKDSKHRSRAETADWKENIYAAVADSEVEVLEMTANSLYEKSTVPKSDGETQQISSLLTGHGGGEQQEKELRGRLVRERVILWTCVVIAVLTSFVAIGVAIGVTSCSNESGLRENSTFRSLQTAATLKLFQDDDLIQAQLLNITETSLDSDDHHDQLIKNLTSWVAVQDREHKHAVQALRVENALLRAELTNLTLLLASELRSQLLNMSEQTDILRQRLQNTTSELEAEVQSQIETLQSVKALNQLVQDQLTGFQQQYGIEKLFQDTMLQNVSSQLAIEQQRRIQDVKELTRGNSTLTFGLADLKTQFSLEQVKQDGIVKNLLQNATQQDLQISNLRTQFTAGQSKQNDTIDDLSNRLVKEQKTQDSSIAALTGHYNQLNGNVKTLTQDNKNVQLEQQRLALLDSTVTIVGGLSSLPSCKSTIRGALRLVYIAEFHTEYLVMCVLTGASTYKWIYVGHEIRASSCVEVKKRQPVATSGQYNVFDSQEKLTQVYCDMDTSEGGWQLIGKASQPDLTKVLSTSSTVTRSGTQGWTNRFGSLLVSEMRVEVTVGSITRAHWFYHLNTPRPLSQLFTLGYGNANHCFEDGISDISYTYDLLAKRQYNQHRCSALQDSCSQLGPRLNSCFTTTGCKPSSSNCFFCCIDGSFSFSGTDALSGQDRNSTAFFGCDDAKCCVCYGIAGDGRNFCSNGCTVQNGGVTSSTGEAYFYIR